MAAAPGSFQEQIHEELTCSICLELFTRPKMLPCQHTFCQSPCLENLAVRGRALKCAVCRQQVRLPPQGVTGLPDNLMAGNMLERLQQSEETREQPSAPTPAAPAAKGTGHLHCNQKQGEPQSQRVTFGGEGSGTGQFDGPSGVTVSDEGEIFVADYGNQRIQVFTLQGTSKRQFAAVVPGGEKINPHDVAMDGEGNLWVVGWTESAHFAVQYNKQGRVLRKFDLQKTGFARGVAVDTRRNHILITQVTEDLDSYLHGAVLVFRPDGRLVKTVGRQQGMGYPWYMTVNGEGNILVSDRSVYVYNEDGQFLFQFGAEGSGEGQLSYPRGICTDRAGNVIVADQNNKRVEMFDKTGKFLKHITIDMEYPCAVAMTKHGQLIVTNELNHKVFILHL
uniref:RING-type domain-containing protein n=1 Tax=Branchiostoma floridae TaxID=7739 RepID=C3ZU11_BRAFL|eukprot:XP_002587886.1 hypothetical protein BRAFLDRAFT_87273 [Branchiostoma floridae]